MRNVYDPSQERADIISRTNLFGRLSDELAGFQNIRIIDRNRQNVLYSTLDGDITQRSNTRILYNRWSQSPDNGAPIQFLESKEDSPVFSYDVEGSRIFYSLPAVDQYGLFQGTVVVDFSISGLQNYLYRNGGLSDINRLHILESDVLVYNLSPEQLVLLRDNITQFREGAGRSDYIQQIASGEGQDYYLVQTIDANGSASVTAIPGMNWFLTANTGCCCFSPYS